MSQVAALLAVSSLRHLGKVLMVIGLILCLVAPPTVFVNLGGGGVVVDVDGDGEISPVDVAASNIQNYASQQGNPINKVFDMWNQFTSLLGEGMSNWDYLALQGVQAEILKDGKVSIDEVVVGGGLAYLGLACNTINPFALQDLHELGDTIEYYCIYRNLGFSEQAALTAASLLHLDYLQFMWGWGKSWQDIATATAVAAAVDGNMELAAVAAAVAWYQAGGLDGNPWTPW